jgi:2-polyprenyl-3-methyl-5-hydroxy-6-metoxy-1,4-benzoquinol methylase
MQADVDAAKKFKMFLSPIFNRNPMQRKMIESFVRSQDHVYWERVEVFSEKLLKVLTAQGLNIEYVAEAYLRMCQDMLSEQIKFKKDGKYSCKTAEDAFEGIYLSEKRMSSYMYGLALSIFLWPNHYMMYDFFIRESKKLISVASYLEVGPGHGLYLVESIKIFSHARFVAVDISPISVRITESVLTNFTGYHDCQFLVKDVHDVEDEKFDYIVMCEVLEHLDDPQSIMLKIHKLLDENGHLFITTCANCPAIDHVYQYQCVEQIRAEIEESGFEIVSEVAFPVGNFPESQWYDLNVEVNYAAMLKRI